MRCWIRFGSHWHASNSLFLNIAHSSVFPLVPKFKNVIITWPFFFNSLWYFTPDKEFAKVFPGNIEIPVLCVSKGPDLARVGPDYWAASCSSVPEGASGLGSDATVWCPDRIRRRPAGSRLAGSCHQSLKASPVVRQTLRWALCSGSEQKGFLGLFWLRPSCLECRSCSFPAPPCWQSKNMHSHWPWAKTIKEN